MVTIPQWAALVGMADDGRSLVTARALITKGDGPQVVQVRRRRRTDTGVQLNDHRRWVRDNEWAKFLAAEAARREEEIRAPITGGLKNPSPVGMRRQQRRSASPDLTVGRPRGFNAVRKAEAWGQGESFSLSKWRPTSLRKPGQQSRDNDGLKWRLAPWSTQIARARNYPRRTMRGLGVLCPLDGTTIEHSAGGRGGVTGSPRASEGGGKKTEARA